MEKNQTGEFGSSTTYTTHFRQYDPRIGRWLSVDPEMARYAHQSPYNFVFNQPLTSVDIYGDCPNGECEEEDVIAANQIVSEVYAGNNTDVRTQIRDRVGEYLTQRYGENSGKSLEETGYFELNELALSIWSDRATLSMIRPGEAALFEELINVAESPDEKLALIISRSFAAESAANDTKVIQVMGLAVETFAMIAYPSGSMRGARTGRLKNFGGNRNLQRGVGPEKSVRAPRDIGVNPNPPRANNGAGTIGRTTSQNNFVKRYTSYLRKIGARDIRVNQQQVNAQGTRVGINRPDIQFTFKGKRHYIEIDRSTSTRGLPHRIRILSNDPSGKVRLRTMD